MAGYFKNIAAIINSGLPVVGSPHPALPTALLRTITAISVSSEEVELRLFYSESFFDKPTITTGATTTQVETNKGDRLLNITDPGGGTLTGKVEDIVVQKITTDADGGKTTEETGVLVNKFTPQSTIEVSRTEFTTSDAITDKAIKFVATTNKAGWAGRRFDKARSWLCTGITGSSNDNGVSWTVTYSFQFRKDLWDVEVIWLQDSGRPYAPLEAGAAGTTGPLRKYVVHGQEDFNQLGLA